MVISPRSDDVSSPAVGKDERPWDHPRAHCDALARRLMAAEPGPSSSGTPTGNGAGEVPAAYARRARRIWVRVILVVATVLAVFAIFAIWANRQLMNPSNWAKTSTALLQKETIRASLSSYLSD